MTKSNTAILDEMISVFKDAGLPIVRSVKQQFPESNSPLSGFKSWKSNGIEMARIDCRWFYTNQVVELGMTTGQQFPKMLCQDFVQAFNILNSRNPSGHLVVYPDDRVVEYRSGMLIVDDTLDKAQYRLFLDNFMKYGMTMVEVNSNLL
jgi:hypothetical protein